MRTFSPLLLLLSPFVRLSSARTPSKRQTPPEGYYNPAENGGNMLTIWGEPINIIISANSDQQVLGDRLLDYFQSLNFSGECNGKHVGDSQQADLGDGNGYVNETAVMRYNFGYPETGTCRQSFEGGNHFRYWAQNGASANSGAIFIASSYELGAEQDHDITVDGYNLGRDLIVGNITQSTVSSPSSSSSYTGSTSSTNNSSNVRTTYETSVQYVEGLLTATSDGINHADTVGVNGQNAIDGLVAVFTVRVTNTDNVDPSESGANSDSTDAATRLVDFERITYLVTLIAGLALMY